VPDSTIRLETTPAGLSPAFSFGCGNSDGSASCDLGAMDAKSAKRQLQAQVTVSATASTIKSVLLKATASSAHLPKDPVASATVTLTAAAEAGTPLPSTTTTPLPVTSLPNLSAPSPTLSPGGNAAGLFPTLQPSGGQSQEGQAGKANTRPVADTSALPEGAPVVGAQLVGLGALALAFVLAVTRLSIRRRSVPVQPLPPEPEAAEQKAPEAKAPEQEAPEPDAPKQEAIKQEVTEQQEAEQADPADEDPAES
jgi:hypothetical protein